MKNQTIGENNIAKLKNFLLVDYWLTIVSAENEPVRGSRELVFEKYLKRLGVCYKTNPVYCFICRDYFEYGKRDMPPTCPIGNHKFAGRGEYCIPDFILVAPLYSDGVWAVVDGAVIDRKKPRILAAIMINEKIHYKNKKHIDQLAGQVHSFLADHIPVFPISGYEIDNASDLQLTSMAYFISHAATNRGMYEAYKSSNEFKEKTASYYQKCGR